MGRKKAGNESQGENGSEWAFWFIKRSDFVCACVAEEGRDIWKLCD